MERCGQPRFIVNALYDVIIIGGGVVGTAIARELSAYHLLVALLEKEEELAFGVSKSNSGIIHPGTQNPSRSLKGRLCVEGNRQMRRIARELGVDFKQVGELIIAFSAEEIDCLLALKKEAEVLGVPGLKVVDRSWLTEHEPYLSAHAVAALYAPTAGIISPYRLVYDLSENAVRNGVELWTNTTVDHIERRSKKNSSAHESFTVHAGKKCFTGRYVINAAGLYADVVSRMAGISDITIKPRKGEEFILDKKKEYISNHLLFPLPSKTSKGILIIKTADGNPMIGPTAHEVKDKQDLSTSASGLQEVLAAARKMIPSIEERDIIAYFAGLRPSAGDDFIIRHEDTVPGLITVAGIQSPGLTAAPAIARMAGSMLKNHGLRMKKKKTFRKYRSKTIHVSTIPLNKTRSLIDGEAGYGDIVCRCELVSAKEIIDAIRRGARTMDGIKFRTRAQSGRCHGGFCTTRIMKILSREAKIPVERITKRGRGSELVKEKHTHA